MAPRLQRLLQALLTTGRTAQERAQWLVAFANRDLSKASREDFDGLRRQLIAWSLGDPQGADLERTFGKALTWCPLLDRVPTDRPSLIREVFQQPLREHLRAFIRDGHVVMHDAAGTPVLKRHENGTVSRRTVGSAVVAVFRAVADLLSAGGPRLAICAAPQCGRFLVVVRRQVYCSPTCSQRVRTARFQRRHRDELTAKKRKARHATRERSLGDAIPAKKQLRRSAAKATGRT